MGESGGFVKPGLASFAILAYNTKTIRFRAFIETFVS
jgi:hypothetical protein